VALKSGQRALRRESGQKYKASGGEEINNAVVTTEMEKRRS